MAVNPDPDFVDDGAPVSDVDDDEFIDDGADSIRTIAPNDDQIGGRQPKKGRGPDLEWIEVQTFSTTNEFKNSEIKKDIDANYSRRKFGNTISCKREVYYCKFLRKRKFKPCYRKLRVSFSESSEEVLVEAVGDYNNDHGQRGVKEGGCPIPHTTFPAYF